MSLQVARIRAVREAGGAARVPLVINARTDAFEVKQWSPAERFAVAVRRANAYRAAGADCLFVPHVSDADTIGRLAREITGPLNVIAGPPAPPLGELERLGVRRASLGPRVVQATLGLIRRIAVEHACPTATDRGGPTAARRISTPGANRTPAVSGSWRGPRASAARTSSPWRSRPWPAWPTVAPLRPTARATAPAYSRRFPPGCSTAMGRAAGSRSSPASPSPSAPPSCLP